jgi:hypothetical protein
MVAPDAHDNQLSDYGAENRVGNQIGFLTD